MRKRWFILAALAGSLATLAVWFWPHGPAWRSGPNAGELHGFSPDGRILVTVDTSSNPVLHRWDAATGRLLSRATLPCADPKRMKRVKPSPDGRVAVVDEDSMKDWSIEKPRGEDRIYLHDGVTGERRAGPLPELRHVGYHAFSPDGQWFGGSLAPTDLKSPLATSFAVFRADTGELLVKTPEEDSNAAMPTGRFAPNGTSIAFTSLRFEPKAPRPRTIIRVLDLPSGQERCRFEAPPAIHVDIRRWDGRFLETRDLGKGDDPQKSPITTRTYDLENGSVGEGVVDPLLSLELESSSPDGLFAVDGGRNWVAYISNASREPPRTGWASRVSSWFGLQRAPLQGHRVNVRVVDRATGGTRFETPRPVGYRCTFSPDGNLLACTGNDQSVEIWNLAPPPRWPKAAALGTVVAGSVLGLGWWRRPRAKSTPG